MIRAILSLVLVLGCLGCASTDIVDPGPPDAVGMAQEDQSWVDDLPLTIDEGRRWWVKTIFWGSVGH